MNRSLVGDALAERGDDQERHRQDDLAHGGVRYHWMNGVGFSLWLVPEGAVRRRLAALIASLARRFGGPVFEPHVTLLAGVREAERDVVARSDEMRRGSSALPLRFTGLETADTYFRALYLRVETSAPLLDLRQAARATFARGDDPPYVPHLSLAYGAPPPAAVVAGVRPRAPDGFEARALDVYSTEGPVESWHRVRRFRLR
jgi:2'-5' RNA ligase